MMTITSLRIFYAFFKRDLYVHGRRVHTLLINHSLLYPLMFSFAFAYIQTNVYFGSGNTTLGTILFSGNIAVTILVLTYHQAIELLFDLEHDRFIDYQMTILYPSLIIVERILFTSLFTFVLALPFFPVAKLLIWNHLDTSNTSWIQLLIILYLGSLCCSAYHQLASVIIPNKQKISILWSRFNIPFIVLGGFWIPFYVIYAYSPLLGNLVRLNPILYVSEGARQSLVGGTQFLSFYHCVCMLIILSIVFTLACLFTFKKRVDHI